ncbi:unnamed protein product [Arctogadus glacialis]
MRATVFVRNTPRPLPLCISADTHVICVPANLPAIQQVNHKRNWTRLVVDNSRQPRYAWLLCQLPQFTWGKQPKRMFGGADLYHLDMQSL